jgi:hypothetical protein
VDLVKLDQKDVVLLSPDCLRLLQVSDRSVSEYMI